MSGSWFAPVPQRRLAIVRAATFGYAACWLLVRARYIWEVGGLPARRFEPVGILELWSTAPARSTVVAIWGVAFGIRDPGPWCSNR